jgi:anti-sigma regulatory factor (Ser/Thr protein kinase)
MVTTSAERSGPVWCTSLPPDARSVPAARHFTARAMRSMGAGQHVDEAELLVSELAANVVLHAHTDMRVSVLGCRGRVRVEVRDGDPNLPRRRTPDPMAVHGRGVMLVDTLAAAWGINGNQRGKTVWFELGAAETG